MNEELEQDPTNLVAVRDVRVEDLNALRPILETWIKDRNTGVLLVGEVAEVLSSIEASCKAPSDTHYMVAENAKGQVIGVMGLQPPDGKMKPYATKEKTGELINAYVADDERIKGVGKALRLRLEDMARSEGYEELVVNSGPRYKDTGWEFWKASYGEPIDVAVGMYGQGGDAMVWRTVL